MGRIANWRAKEVFGEIADAAMRSASDIMDNVVAAARAYPVPVLVDLAQERPDGWKSANVSFTPKTGKNKGRAVSFSTDKQWLGRKRGDLSKTIRKVTSDDRVGNFRVYAGNFKIYYAFMVEKSGYTDRKGRFHDPIPFLRSPFNAQKSRTVSKIQSDVDAKTLVVG